MNIVQQFDQNLRTMVLLQAIKDASQVSFPPDIRSALNRVEFYIETHQGVYKPNARD